MCVGDGNCLLQVQYVLSDKTGTLTQNVMGFVWASIGGTLYGKRVDAGGLRWWWMQWGGAGGLRGSNAGAVHGQPQYGLHSVAVLAALRGSP